MRDHPHWRWRIAICAQCQAQKHSEYISVFPDTLYIRCQEVLTRSNCLAFAMPIWWPFSLSSRDRHVTSCALLSFEMAEKKAPRWLPLEANPDVSCCENMEKCISLRCDVKSLYIFDGITLIPWMIYDFFNPTHIAITISITSFNMLLRCTQSIATLVHFVIILLIACFISLFHPITMHMHITHPPSHIHTCTMHGGLALGR